MSKIKGIRVTDSQAAVYGALKGFRKGLPDHAFVPFAQHALGVRQSSSGIRSRRAELAANGLVVDTGRTVRTASNRKATVWAVR